MEAERPPLENVTLPELYADLSARLGVSEDALVSLFRRIFQANPKILEETNWSVIANPTAQNPEAVLVTTKDGRLGYILGTQPYSGLDNISGQMVDMRTPILISRLQRQPNTSRFLAHSRRNYGPDKFEPHEE